jgi:hypothetical protein
VLLKSPRASSLLNCETWGRTPAAKSARVSATRIGSQECLDVPLFLNAFLLWKLGGGTQSSSHIDKTDRLMDQVRQVLSRCTPPPVSKEGWDDARPAILPRIRPSPYQQNIRWKFDDCPSCDPPILIELCYSHQWQDSESRDSSGNKRVLIASVSATQTLKDPCSWPRTERW